MKIKPLGRFGETMSSIDVFNGFYSGKRVLVTGHTGFKGSWLSIWLHELGAEVIGVAQDPFTARDNFVLSGIGEKIKADLRADIRDGERIKAIFQEYQPEIVFHLAAQPLVRLSYDIPVEPYETNVMGTIHVLEAVRSTDSVKVGVMITTDKCYENKEQIWGYRENEPMGGYDPYSSSKGAAEIAIASWRRSFFNPEQYDKHGKSIASVRAGNVIGGGDWALDRIIPDCVRAVSGGKKIAVRNPHSTRPYQHVLEPLGAYLLIAEEQYQDSRKAGSYNVGPDDRSCLTTGELADLFCTAWGNGAAWENLCQGGPHEANFLKLDCSRIRNRLGWKPRWQVDEAVVNTAKWYQAWLAGQNMAEYTDCQIKEYFGI